VKSEDLLSRRTRLRRQTCELPMWSLPLVAGAKVLILSWLQKIPPREKALIAQIVVKISVVFDFRALVCAKHCHDQGRARAVVRMQRVNLIVVP
jgi:hypothetical protein